MISTTVIRSIKNKQLTGDLKKSCYVICLFVGEMYLIVIIRYIPNPQAPLLSSDCL